MIAWIKQVEIEDTGATVEFWKLRTVHYDDDTEMSTFYYAGWVNAAAFFANKSPLINRSHQVPKSAAPEIADGALGAGIGFVLQLPMFSGATMYEP